MTASSKVSSSTADCCSRCSGTRKTPPATTSRSSACSTGCATDMPIGRGEGGLLRRLFERAPDGMLVTRLRDGRIVMANEASARLLGVAHGDLVVRTTVEVGLHTDTERDHFV